jgi:hypothetical protein
MPPCPLGETGAPGWSPGRGLMLVGLSGGVAMPRVRLLVQIDHELVEAKKSLAFWRDQTLLLADTKLQACAVAQVEAYERVIKQLVAVQEQLFSIEGC